MGAHDIYEKMTVDMKPEEFERYCLEILKGYAEEEKLKDFKILHNEKMQAPDGVYQIDIYSEFIAMGGIMKIICECKKYASSVKREKVEVLYNRVRSLGVDKGIFMSTAGYQSGAIEFAKAHGISLIQITDKFINFITMAWGFSEKEIQYRSALQNLYPKFVGKKLTEYGMEDVYPTSSMVKEMHKKLKELFNSEK
jgi:hypothetical protein